MALPDPEMRKFLVTGTAETVRNALSQHVAAGMEIIENLENLTLLLIYNGQEAVIDPSQQLKLTVRAANTLMETPAP